MPGWRIGLGVSVVVALAVVTAFVVGSAMRQEPEVIASEPIARSPAPSPTTTAEPDPMPELHNTGEDFDAIIRSIEEFRSWLYRNPQPDLVTQIYHPACPCHAEMVDRLERLSRAGYRVSQGGARVESVHVLDRLEDVVGLKVVDESLPTVVVDATTGAVIDSDEGRGPAAFRVLLTRTGSRWLVKDMKHASLDLPVESGS